MAELIIPVLLAVVTHELGHILFLKLFGIKHGCVNPRFFGLSINADMSTVPYFKSLIVYAAGSLADIVLSLTLLPYREASFCALAYGIFNLLPAGFLDGGEILGLILRLCGASDLTAFKAVSASTHLVTFAVWVIGVYLAIVGAGLSMLVSAVFMLFISQRRTNT